MVFYIECYIICASEFNLELQNTAEKEPIIGGSTIQYVFVEQKNEES